MDFKELIHWLEEQRGQPGGNITVVQTLRNDIMAASVLASAALVALMGVLATSSLHPRLTVASATGMLVLSCFFSLRTIWMLALLSFQLQQLDRTAQYVGKKLGHALLFIRVSAVFLFLALSAAAYGLFM
jgi:hypothetical protein